MKEDPSISALWKYHINKARHNIETGALLIEVSLNPETKKQLKASTDYTGYDWSNNDLSQKEKKQKLLILTFDSITSHTEGNETQ